MDCEIPFIYIAETQRPRTIMSKTRSIAIFITRTPRLLRAFPCVRYIQLEYLGRYMHQTLVLYFIVNYFIFRVLQR